MAKKIITYRIDNEDEKKLMMIEETFKREADEEGIILNRTISMSKIINLAFDKIFNDGTSSTQFEQSLLKNIEEKISDGFDMINNTLVEKDRRSNDMELTLTELIEDVELILKLLPYSKEYRNPDNSDKTREILELVQSKSMFRKYTQSKAKKVNELKKNKIVKKEISIMADNKKKKRTYELDEATIVQLNQIVEVMKLREETGSDGKMYSLNIAVAEAINYYYNTVVNCNPTFFTRIASSITSSLMYRYLKPFTETANQMLINDVRQKIFNEALADKLV